MAVGVGLVLAWNANTFSLSFFFNFGEMYMFLWHFWGVHFCPFDFPICWIFFSTWKNSAFWLNFSLRPQFFLSNFRPFFGIVFFFSQ